MGKFPAIFFESAGKFSKFEKIINMNFDVFFKKKLYISVKRA
jgi:hypothetical protein